MSASVESAWKSKIVNAIEIPILTKCCLCIPLRRGLITFAYGNLALTLVVLSLITVYLTKLHSSSVDPSEYPRLITDFVALAIEVIMTIVFITGLHMKHVTLMKTYLYFEIFFSFIGFIYSVAFLMSESAGELFLILFQLTLQIYFAVLIWSSIVKMERDGSVKYTREQTV